MEPKRARPDHLDDRVLKGIEQLEANWQLILADYRKLSDGDFIPWIEPGLFNQGWEVFGFYAFGKPMPEHCHAFPETARLCRGIPGMTTAGFSRLQPGTEIYPHTGYSGTVYRSHLGLIVPPGGHEVCGITVAGENFSWDPGKMLVFDDTLKHSAWNRHPDMTRVVLLIDFLREVPSGTV